VVRFGFISECSLWKTLSDSSQKHDLAPLVHEKVSAGSTILKIKVMYGNGSPGAGDQRFVVSKHAPGAVSRKGWVEGAAQRFGKVTQ